MYFWQHFQDMNLAPCLVFEQGAGCRMGRWTEFPQNETDLRHFLTQLNNDDWKKSMIFVTERIIDQGLK